MPCLSGILGYFVFDYFSPILGLRLLDLGLTETETGLFFCVGSIAYIIGSLITPNLPKTVKKKAWIIFGVLVQFPVQILNGPSQLFDLPVSLYLMGAGQFLQGLLDPYILVFILPEMIDVVEQKYPQLSEKQKAKLADLSSGVLNGFLGIG